MTRRAVAVTPLRAARQKLGYDLDFVHAGLCALIDDDRRAISRRTLGDWERGKQVPHPYWVRRLCLFYNLKPHELGLAPAAERAPAPGPLEGASAQATYLRRLCDQFGVLRLPIGPVEGFSLDAVFQPLRLCQPVSLSEPFSGSDRGDLRDGDVFDHVWESATSARRGAVDGEDSRTVANSHEALASSPWRRIMILGGPGAGRSTLLKHLVGDLAWRALSDPGAPVPIFIALPDFARSGKTFKGYLVDLVQNLMIDDEFAEVLWSAVQRGHALVCLDSLDEVLSGRSDLVDRLRLMMSGAHPSITWVLSSRFTDYKRGQFAAVHVTEWELLQMDRPARSGVAARLIPELHTRMPQSTAKTDAGTFLRTLERHPRIATWGRNPLLFSLAAILYVRTGNLPDSRSALYLRVIDAIMEIRQPSVESRLTLRDVFAAVAYRLFLERKGRTFLVADLIATLRVVRAEQHESWRLDEVARAMANSGLLEATGGGAFSFLHQTVQECLAAYYVASIPTPSAEREIGRLLTSIHEPFCRQILIELAYLSHQFNRDIEDYLYDDLIRHYQDAKLGGSDPARKAERATLSAVVLVVVIVLEALVDLWEERYRATLDAGSPAKPDDVEVASAIASIFELFPRASAVPSLIAGLRRFPKRARFIGALGRIATDEARDALLAFAREQLDSLSDPPVLLYLVAAIGDSRAISGIPILKEIRDTPVLDLDTRIEAHTALINLGVVSDFPDEMVYSLDRIQSGLRIWDDFDRPSDWARVKRFAEWIPRNIDHPLLRTHRGEIIRLVEGAAGHAHDVARIPVVTALGKIGDEESCRTLLGIIEEGTASGDLTEAILIALHTLIDRGSARALPMARFRQAFRAARARYQFLTDEVSRAEQALEDAESEA